LKKSLKHTLNAIWNYISGLSRVRFGYWCIFIMGASFIFISILRFPVVDIKTLKKRDNVKLTSKPYFENDESEIQLNLKGFVEVMKINGIDYRCVNEKKFNSEIKKDSLINILFLGDRIYSIEKDGVYYLNLGKANKEKEKNIKLSLGIGIFLMFFTSFGIFGKEEPSIKLGIVIVVAYVFTFFLLNAIIGFP